ncbi:MAG: response regulator [Candidatus Omnitrophota bacterium]|jgi:CheY-like chemotaxis protein|nr:MAG: response regulator [Candidatus Omnitrophota bacterium]
MNVEPSRKHSILVVEDDPDFSALLQSVLQEDDYQVAVAHNGEEAFQYMKITKPDLITLDIHMPKQSGLFFYRKIKSTYEFMEIPVIVVTGLMRNDRDMNLMIRSFLETEHIPVPNAYFDKPLDEQRLLQKVNEILHPSSNTV